MGKKWHGSKFKGVRFYEHEIRKHGVRKDRYYTIRYQKDGKRREEGLGWASQGWSEQKAALTLAELKQASITGKGAATLKERRANLEAKRRQRQLDSLSFGQFFREMYFPQAQADKSPSSYSREDALFRIWITPVIGEIPLKDISPFHLEKIKKSMANAGQSPRSIQYALAIIRQVFNHARRLGLYNGENPISKIKMPRVNNGRLRFLTHDEADLLLETLRERSQQTYEMAMLALYCGLRFGEIAGLAWQDININEGILIIRDSKSGYTRYAYMPSQVKAMLEAKERETPDSLVFPDRHDGRMRKISRTFDRTIVELGLNDDIADSRMKATFHTLRHSFASWLVQDGVDFYTVQKMLGHLTGAMTQRYSHLAKGTFQAAIRTLEPSFEKHELHVFLQIPPALISLENLKQVLENTRGQKMQSALKEKNDRK